MTDTGAEYQGTNEAQLAMELADLVAARLEAAGLKVSYTREDDDIAGITEMQAGQRRDTAGRARCSCLW